MELLYINLVIYGLLKILLTIIKISLFKDFRLSLKSQSIFNHMKERMKQSRSISIFKALTKLLYTLALL